MSRLIITGAAGRMGKRLVALTLADDALSLAAAVDHPESDDIGVDAGTCAGVLPAGVPIVGELALEDLAAADVVIDFSARETAAAFACQAVDAGCGVVIGTTGLSAEDGALLEKLGSRGRVLVAPNMSVGINLLFLIAEQVAKALSEDYDIEVVEMHHGRKKDAPSGTAKRLGEILAEARGWDYEADTSHGRQGMVGERPMRQIGMHALRGGDVIGEHTVLFAGEGERIELTHRASSRDAFARGALRAAKFLAGAPNGFYCMRDVLGL